MIIQLSPELEKLRPKLIPSLLSGFEAIANHLWLILLPVLLDISLWMGPHLRIKTIVQPFIDSAMEFVQTTQQQIPNLDSVQTIWQVLLERFNLVFSIRTLPVGLPSLMANWMPIQTPLGQPVAIELSNGSELFRWLAVFVLVGLLLSSIYYGEIARITSNNKEARLTPGNLGWLTLQLLILTGVVLLIGLLFGLPVLTVISGLTYLNQNLGILALFIAGMAVIWVVMPMVFSAHGIFVNHQSLRHSVITSIQIVRTTFSSTGLFVLTCVILSQGLNMLWEVPREDSWLLLVGILGHAFINTSIIAASFYYYRDALRFFQTLLSKSQMGQSSSPEAIK